MKHLTISLLTLTPSISFVVAQNSNLVFYTPKGELFYVELNGVRQNTTPVSFVRVKNYNSTDCHAKIIFKVNSKKTARADLKYSTGKETVFAIKDQGMAYTIKWEKDLPLHLTTDTKEGHIEVNYKTPEGKIIEKPLTGKEFIEAYKGQKNCETPILHQSLETLKTKLKVSMMVLLMPY